MDVVAEIAALEETLRLAELGPDPDVFDRLLAADVVLVNHAGGRVERAQVIDAHRPGAKPQFTRVEMRDTNIVEQGDAAIVTCTGEYENKYGVATLKFLRVWLRRNDRWQIVAASIHM
ncbi:MAG: nuclear transport factor 2 family protein [Candidatus Eremiobacteraeota bacterium]|nr:nuclear transport factor 2 family protein [Candidatus Eremiobacteraeota bacterium]